tara:strand:+ start:1989 stop:2843 length:855 start_codon:yes stop_codon:yes gene_type:complete
MEATIEKKIKTAKKATGKKKTTEKVEAETVIVKEEVIEAEPEKQECIEEESPVVEFTFDTFCDEIELISKKISECSQSVKDISFLSKENRSRFDSLLGKYEKADLAFGKAIRSILLTTVQHQDKLLGNKNKSSSTVKKDSSKAAVHIPHNVQPYLLTFMGHDSASSQKVSRNEALNAITTFVKNEHEKKNPDIVVDGNKKYFKLIGTLAQLFVSIGKTMEEKQSKFKSDIAAFKKQGESISPEDIKLMTKMEEDLAKIDAKLPIPSEICYTEIMGYMTHCFIKE